MNPDLILLAGTVHTLDGPSDAVQAVAVRNGVIAAVGSRADAAAWPAAKVIDFGAAVLTPGLVDCHIHPVFGLEMTVGCDVSGVQDLDEVRSLLRAEAEAAGPGDWVRGWGLDPNVSVRRLPTGRESTMWLGAGPASSASLTDIRPWPACGPWSWQASRGPGRSTRRRK